MSTERSDKLHADWRASTEKFDYFVLGALGALCAFIGQGYKPAKLGFNPTSLELVALFVLVSAVIFGFRRIEKTLLVTALNQMLLHANEARGGMVSKMEKEGYLINQATGEIFSQEQAREKVAEHTSKIQRIRPELEAVKAEACKDYRRRNHLALTGFFLLIAAKVWSAYV